MNSKQSTSLDKFVKELAILHYAMVAGLLMVVVIMYALRSEARIDFSDTSDIFLFICPLLAIAGIYFGQKMYNNKIEELKNESNFEDKLAGFRLASVRKYAFIEGPALISVLIYFQSQNMIYLIIAAGLLVYFYMQNVTKEKVMEELRIK